MFLLILCSCSPLEYHTHKPNISTATRLLICLCTKAAQLNWHQLPLESNEVVFVGFLVLTVQFNESPTTKFYLFCSWVGYVILGLCPLWHQLFWLRLVSGGTPRACFRKHSKPELVIIGVLPYQSFARNWSENSAHRHFFAHYNTDIREGTCS